MSMEQPAIHQTKGQEVMGVDAATEWANQVTLDDPAFSSDIQKAYEGYKDERAQARSSRGDFWGTTRGDLKFFALISRMKTDASFLDQVQKKFDIQL